MTSRHLSNEELDRNYDAFRAVLPELLKHSRGRFAIVRDGAVMDLFDTSRDAYICGWRLFDDELFSVQEVTDEPIYLGIFSHALGDRPA